MLRLKIPRLPQAALLRRAALAYLIIWMLSPPLAYGAGWRVLAVAAMLLWLALDALSPRSVLLRPNWPVLCTLVFIFYTAFIEWLVPDAASINRQFPIWIMLFFLLVGESQRRGHSDDAKFCFWVILAVLPVWSIATLWGINTIAGDVARTIARSSQESRDLAGQGIGGYGYVYTVVLCLPFLAHLAFRARTIADRSQARWKRRFQRMLIWGNFVLAVLLILRAGYSIALILSAFAILSVLLIHSRRPLPLAMSVCFVGLLVLVGAVTVKPVLGVLEGAATGTEYSAKVRDIRASLEDEQSTGTVEGRTERYIRSIRLFVENPVIGTLTFDDVGKHSAVLDRFAQYGFGFGLLFLALLIHVPLRVARSPGAPIGLALAFLIVALGFPMSNNVFMSWGLVLYVFSQGAFAVMGPSPDQRGRKRALEGGRAHA
ncbi:MAG: hypothetical protein IPH14_06015 [Thermomonas sp.]|uniref:O-antigen ligase family protein n=1 Tax=Thermomonas sp. TaxID=1971895 RepID=UPI0025DD607B|nr:O-antigen ligase family protein [Thermomonas sp.]MBK6924820.1 hypothetical protein [Thermomonas sp.]